MHAFLKKGLTETHLLWTDVEKGYQWVHRAAHLLTNEENQDASQVRQTYEALLAEMEQTPTTSETLTTMLAMFRKVTASYFPGLFHCYDVVIYQVKFTVSQITCHAPKLFQRKSFLT
jgi:hypothetical protein